MKTKLFLLLALCAAAMPVLGQTSFNGRVIDNDGAVLPATTITATNVDTGVVRTSATNSDGLYTLPSMDPGKYNIKAETKGFAPVEFKDVQLVTGNQQTINFSLHIADVTQQVEVTATLAPMVETTQSAVGGSIQSNEVRELPMLNRNLTGILTLLPGTSDAPTTTPMHIYIVVAGGEQGSLMLVDGLDNHDDSDGGTGLTFSLEGVDEFKLLAHNFSAEYGKGATAIMLMTSKSGGNNIHGSVFGFGRNDSMTKIDYLSDPQHGGGGKPPYAREQYGAAIGGPIVKSRGFYFGDFERITQNYTQPVSGAVYQQGLVLQNNLPGHDILAAPFIGYPSKDLMILAKTNWQIGKSHSAYVRYAQEGFFLNNSSVTAAHTLLASSPGNTDQKQFRTFNEAIGDTWVINNSTVNEFGAEQLNFHADDHMITCSQYASVGECISNRMTFPSVSTGLYEGVDWDIVAQQFQIKDTLSKQFGRNSLKVGIDFDYVPKDGASNGNQNGGNPGSVSWFDDPSTIVGSKASWAANPATCTAATCGLYPQGFQTPGAVRAIVVTTSNPGSSHTAGEKDFGAFIQDDLKATSRLTLNLGLRWDIACQISECGGSPLLPKSVIYQSLQQMGSPFGRLPLISKTDFSPRVGMAWDIRGNGKDAVRASYGIYFLPIQIVTVTNQQLFLTPNPYIAFGETFGPNSKVGTGPLSTFVYGVTPIPTGPGGTNTALPVGKQALGAWFDPNLTDQYEQQTSVGYSHAFTSSTAVAVDYTHQLGIHEWDTPYDINPICQLNAAYPTVATLPAGCNGTVGTRLLAPLEAAAFAGDSNRLGVVNVTSSIGRSIYDALTVHFEHRARQVTLQANYTLSSGHGWGGNLGGNGSSASNNPEIWSPIGGRKFGQGEYGPGPFNELHRLTVSGVIELPFHFEASPTLSTASARPYQLFRSTNPDGDGNLHCWKGTASCTTAPAGEPGITSTGTSSFADPANEVGVNAGRGQMLFVLSSRVTRSFHIKETKKLDAFAEFFNITDRGNFGNNYGTIATGASTFMKPTGYLGSAGGSAAGGSGTASIPTSFQVQFGARFSF